MVMFSRTTLIGLGLILESLVGMSTAAQSHSSNENDLAFTVRSLFHNNNNSEDKRKLLDFIPTFSEDGILTELPVLTLQLKGLPGTPLSEDAYDAIQYAMTDYLYDLFQPRWPSTSTSDFDAGNVGDTVLNGSTNNNARDPTAMNKRPALTSVKVEVVNDQPLARRRRTQLLRTASHDDDRQQRRSLQATGNAIDLLTTLSFRDLTQPEDAEEAITSVGNGSGTTTNATGVAFNEAADGTGTGGSNTKSASLSLPPEEILQGAAGDAWNDLNVFSVYLFDAVGREGTDVVAEFANLQGVSATEVFPTSPPTMAPTEGPSEEGTLPRAPDTPFEDPTGGEGEGDNVVASINGSTNMVASRSGINPLYPALIAGMAVFLCTIIVLGYRRRRSSELIGNKSDLPPPSVNVHDTFTLDGDEEIEVENPMSKQSCISKNLSRSRSVESQDDNSDVDDTTARRGRGGFCGRSNRMRTPRALDNTYEESFEEDDAMHERYSDRSDRPSIGGVPREDMDLYADLSSAEKQQFLRYMHAGMSIEEASQRVLEGRQSYVVSRSMMAPPPSSPRRGFSQSQPQQHPRLNSEVMADGQTMLHHLPHDVDARPNYNRSLVLDETESSVNSSFDDRDYYQQQQQGRGMGSILNLGRSRSTGGGGGDYSEAATPTRSSKKGRGRGGRVIKSPRSSGGKDVGRSILCNPELGL